MNQFVPATRKEIEMYYRIWKLVVRKYAKKIQGVLMINDRRLDEELDMIRTAEKFALSNAEEEKQRLLVIWPIDERGVVVAEIESYTTDGKNYRMSYDPANKTVFCACEAFRGKNWTRLNFGEYPLVSQPELHCKHLRDSLDRLLKAGTMPSVSTLGSNAS